MLCPFSTDIVPAKIERGECLYWSIMADMQSIRRQVVLPCCCVVLEPDVVPLQHRYCSREDRAWWVSILIDNGGYAVDQKTSCLTVLWCSAWARCCAQSWNRSKFFGPDRTGRSDFSDRTGPADTGRSIFLTGPVKNRQKPGRSKFWTWPAKNRSLIILDLTGEKPLRCMYQFTNQFFRETVCRFSSTET
jgi:hypothetical protein